MPLTAPPFQPFDRVHLATVTVIVALIALATWWGRSRSIADARRGGRVLGAVLLVYYLIESIVRVRLLGVAPIIILPLEICSILFFVGAAAFWTETALAAEMLFFWTFAGTLHSLITPTPGAGFPSLEFFRYFACHGLLILSAVYSAVAIGRPLTFRSMVRALVALQVWQVFVALVDALTGENFMYQRHKPPSPTLFDALGPWPYYLLGVELIAIVSFYLWFRVATFILKGPLGRKVTPSSGVTA